MNQSCDKNHQRDILGKEKSDSNTYKQTSGMSFFFPIMRPHVHFKETWGHFIKTNRVKNMSSDTNGIQCSGLCHYWRIFWFCSNKLMAQMTFFVL